MQGSQGRNCRDLPRKQRAVRIPPYHNRITQPWIFNQPQDSPTAYEGVGTCLPCQNQEISFLQRKSGKNCSQSAEPELLCGKAKPEMGDRCNLVQFVWTENVPLAHFGFTQRLSGQLYHL